MVDLPSGSRGLGGLEPAYRVGREKEAKVGREVFIWGGSRVG